MAGWGIGDAYCLEPGCPVTYIISGFAIVFSFLGGGGVAASELFSQALLTLGFFNLDFTLGCL